MLGAPTCRRPTLLYLALPCPSACPAAMPRSACPPVVCLAIGFDMSVPNSCLACEGFENTKMDWLSGQQPGAKNGCCPADATRLNCASAVGCVPPRVYMGFRLFVLPKKMFRTGVLHSLEALGCERDGCHLGGPTCRRPLVPSSAPLRLAMMRPGPPVVCPRLDLTRKANCRIYKKYHGRGRNDRRTSALPARQSVARRGWSGHSEVGRPRVVAPFVKTFHLATMEPKPTLQ